jgi:hypothetical protein
MQTADGETFMVITNRTLWRRLAGFLAGLGCVLLMTNLSLLGSFGHALAFPGQDSSASILSASQFPVSSFQEFAATHLEPNFYQ